MLDNICRRSGVDRHPGKAGQKSPVNFGQTVPAATIDHVDVFEGDRIHIQWKFDPE